MPHIEFGGSRFPIDDEQFDLVQQGLSLAYKNGDAMSIEILHDDGDTSILYWTPGAPIALNSWEVPEFEVPDIPPMMPRLSF